MARECLIDCAGPIARLNNLVSQPFDDAGLQLPTIVVVFYYEYLSTCEHARGNKHQLCHPAYRRDIRPAGRKDANIADKTKIEALTEY